MSSELRGAGSLAADDAHEPPAAGERPLERGFGSAAPCAPSAGQHLERFVYAIGKLEVGFPNKGIDREFRRCTSVEHASLSRGERLQKVFEAHQHLAPRVAFLLRVAGNPAFLLTPTTPQARSGILASLPQMGSKDYWMLVVGRQGPMCNPSESGGLLVPHVACDQLQLFSTEGWIKEQEAAAKLQLAATNTASAAFGRAAQELFDHVADSMHNIGATDSHRALNFAVLRHPGVLVAVAQRMGVSALHKIEARSSQGIGMRRTVAVILTFVDSNTAVPERRYCRIDVTDEWPFIADQADGNPAPLGLLDFIETEILGAPF